ncbi:F-box/kelch-repeat protein At3g06240-like [Bidens hawaiensis]|uniref:F-box/kelch-repeat protein At3g06240-like n=1 Tax=Bidens hawaiensis TaxID=980011 RepID=UPI0040499F81
MANIHIGDDILHNILGRLPGKPLLRFRCVSKHWNALISDPCFMRSRSRRMILLPFTRPLVVIDDNVPAEDEAHSMVTIPSPLKHDEGTHVSVVGALNGIVLLALHDTSLRCHLVLYNPLTCASKILVAMDRPCSGHPYVFGFGYGVGDDLKIVRLKTVYNRIDKRLYKYDVFDLKTSLWSGLPYTYLIRDFELSGQAGLFVNGFLYWSAYFSNKAILALNVKEMVFSKVEAPNGHYFECNGLVLGVLDGCLCMINNSSNTNIAFDLWLMKEEDVWLKIRSFSFGSEANRFYPICILGDGKVLIQNFSFELVNYATSKDSYKALKGLADLDESMATDWIGGFNDQKYYVDYRLAYSRPIHYVESLLSPFDMC